MADVLGILPEVPHTARGVHGSGQPDRLALVPGLGRGELVQAVLQSGGNLQTKVSPLLHWKRGPAEEGEGTGVNRSPRGVATGLL